MPLPESVRDLLQIAAELAGVPYAAAGLARSGEVAGVGFGFELPSGTAAGRAFVRAVVEQGTVVIPDATRDPRVRESALVSGPPHLRFLLGVPLVGDGERRIGYLAVADSAVRTAPPVRIELLELVARSVVTHLRLARAEERRAAEELELKRSAAIVRASDDTIVSVDRAGRILSWNPAAARTFGYDASEVMGRDFSFMTAPDALAEAWSTFRRILDDPTVFRIELPLQTRGGVRFDASITGSPIRDADGSALAVAAIIRDVSELRRIGREHTELQTRLAQGQRLEALGRLAGGVAHDFNNLLAVILNFAAFVEEDLPPDSSLRADVGEIRRAAARAAEITRQLLLFSRQEPALTEPVDLDELLHDFAPLLRRSIGEAIDLRLEPGFPGGTVAVNRAQLEQVLLNLVLNAGDAMPDGGRLTIATRRLAHQPAMTELRVTDTGTGMTEEVRARAFEPFFTTKRAGSGTGLGLATSYGVIERFGGSITLASAPGRGTTATVTLPVSGPENGATPPAGPRVADEPAGRALVVEDAEGVRHLVVRILERAGWDVMATPAAHEALALLAREQAVDAVVSDVALDGMSGVELLERLREQRPGLPVVLMSGYTRETLGNDLGAPLLTKPFSADDLLRALREARSGSRSRGSSR